jgi:hypothetical protein
LTGQCNPRPHCGAHEYEVVGNNSHKPPAVARGPYIGHGMVTVTVGVQRRSVYCTRTPGQSATAGKRGSLHRASATNYGLPRGRLVKRRYARWGEYHAPAENLGHTEPPPSSARRAPNYWFGPGVALYACSNRRDVVAMGVAPSRASGRQRSPSGCKRGVVRRHAQVLLMAALLVGSTVPGPDTTHASLLHKARRHNWEGATVRMLRRVAARMMTGLNRSAIPAARDRERTLVFVERGTILC